MTLEAEAIDDLVTGRPLPDEPAAREEAPGETDAPGEAEAPGEADTPGEADSLDVELGPAPEAGGDPDQESDDEPAPLKRRRPGKAARKITRLEAENRALRERLARLEDGAEAGVEDAAAETGAPRQEDYEDREAYLIAKAKHELRAELREEREAERARAADQAQRDGRAAIAERFQAQLAEARGKYDDYEATARAAAPYVTDVMLAVIAESDLGAEIIYHLGSKPEEASRIARLSNASQAREVGRIEARLEAVRTRPPRKVTDAPDPPGKVRSTGATEQRPDRMTMEEYRSYRGFGE